MKKMNIAIIGAGFVGKAVAHGFKNENINQYIVDPKGGLDIEELKDKNIDVSFICVPTPMGENGEIDVSIVQSVVTYLKENIPGIIVLKSTVTPNYVKEFSEQTEKFIYNPEFLREKTALWDFEHPIMHVFGGNEKNTKVLEEIYKDYSNCAPCPIYHMKAHEASFVKYGMNCFLATKVLWFNQYFDIIEQFGDSDYDTIIEAIGTDERIGSSHTKVPGHDGKKGFGGACFGKDTNALNLFTDFNHTILNETIKRNSEYRNMYSLDEREKEQNIRY